MHTPIQHDHHRNGLKDYHSCLPLRPSKSIPKPGSAELEKKVPYKQTDPNLHGNLALQPTRFFFGHPALLSTQKPRPREKMIKLKQNLLSRKPSNKGRSHQIKFSSPADTAVPPCSSSLAVHHVSPNALTGRPRPPKLHRQAWTKPHSTAPNPRSSVPGSPQRYSNPVKTIQVLPYHPQLLTAFPTTINGSQLPTPFYITDEKRPTPKFSKSSLLIGHWGQIQNQPSDRLRETKQQRVSLPR